MVPRSVAASLLLVGTLVPAPFALSGGRQSGQQSAIVRFERPTYVATRILVGSYVIVHDEDNMTRGEPCTTLYRVGGRSYPLEKVVAFYCIPHVRETAGSFTTTVDCDKHLGIDTLTEYQFAGDSEGHGVPSGARPADPLHGN